MSDHVWPRPYALALLLIASFPGRLHAAPSVPDPRPPADASSVPPPSASDPFADDPFTAGSRDWSATASASCDSTLGWVYLAQANVRYYFAENLAIDYGGMLGYVNARRAPEGALGGPQLGLRWHVAKGRRWSTYLEGLAGAVFQQNPITPETLRFNFDLQPGVGATYRLSERLMAQGGFRWHHLSNAQIRGRAHNFGYDGPTLYVGLAESF